MKPIQKQIWKSGMSGRVIEQVTDDIYWKVYFRTTTTTTTTDLSLDWNVQEQLRGDL